MAQLARYMQATSVVHLDMPKIMGVHVHELQDDRHAPSACRLGTSSCEPNELSDHVRDFVRGCITLYNAV